MNATPTTGRPTKACHELRRGRALHLVDMDNLVGTGQPTAAQVREAWGAYQAVIQPGDHVVVACAQEAAHTVWFIVGDSARLLARAGRDGADRALLDDVDLQHTAARYEWLVVASGDHIFAPLVRRARLIGLRTWHVSGRAPAARILVSRAQVHSHLRLSGRRATAARVKVA